MVGVVDLEITEAEGSAIKDTWILRLPKEICDIEGFAEGTLVSLTVKNGGIQSSFIRPPSDKVQEISQTVLEKDRELHRRLKEVGD